MCAWGSSSQHGQRKGDDEHGVDHGGSLGGNRQTGLWYTCTVDSISKRAFGKDARKKLVNDALCSCNLGAHAHAGRPIMVDSLDGTAG